MIFVPLLFSLLLFPNVVNSYNFLVYNPIFGFSHSKFMSKLADVLADEGHNVTVFQPYHNVLKGTDKLIKNKNVEILEYFPDDYEEMKKTDAKTFAEFWDSWIMNNAVLSSLAIPKVLMAQIEREATRVLKDTSLHQQLKDRKFDALLSEVCETAGFYLSHLIGVNPIAVLSTVRMPSESVFGQPAPIGYVPGAGSALPPNAGFLDRLNDVYTEFFYAATFNGILDEQDKSNSRAIGEDLGGWRELVRKSPILIANSNPYLNFAIPFTSNIIHVGGITTSTRTAKKIDPLPEEYENILNERESTVLVSFGSVVRSFQMPDSFKAGLITMFESLPEVTFIWKYERDDVEFEKKLPKNVYLKKWVPQPALLADDRLKVFVTHGGLGSTMEVAYSGKPALMIPLFGDQPVNAQMLARHGGAVAYDKFQLSNGEKLSQVMKDMVTSPKYKQNAQQLKDVLHNQPIDPKETFLKHIEFAVKFPNFHSQIPEISNAGFIAYRYLDVVAFFAISFVLSVYIIVKLFSKILRRFVTLQSKPKSE